jgi:prevent-host-death family protein
MIQPSDIHTVTDFKRRTNELLERLESSGRPQVLTVDGRPKVVLLGVADFERLMDLLDRADTLAGIRRGLADMKAGRTMSIADAEAALRKKLKSRRRA